MTELVLYDKDMNTTTATEIDLTIDIDIEDTALDLLEMQATSDDEHPFVLWMDSSKRISKMRMSATRLAECDRTLPAFAFISFAPRA